MTGGAVVPVIAPPVMAGAHPESTPADQLIAICYHRSQMMVCQGCGAVIADGAANCPHCNPHPWAKKFGKASPIAILLWKFKTFALLALTKGKLLLLGLTKFSTIASMLVSFGVYWTRWGWEFAAGFVLSIYVHEMGHVAALKRFGIAATAPMFIPGFGALIWQKEAAKNAGQDAIVGLAGPLWGTGAALVALAAYGITHLAVWGAIARTGAWINLFNLTPILFLDGSHAFRALARRDRMLIVAAAVAVWAITHVGMLLLVAGVAAFRCFSKDAPEQGIPSILIEFLGLVGVLGFLAGLPV